MKLRNSKHLLQFYKDFLIDFSSLLLSLPFIQFSHPPIFLSPSSSSLQATTVPPMRRAHSGQLHPLEPFWPFGPATSPSRYVRP